MNVDKKELEEKLRQTDDSEKEAQRAEDNDKLQGVLTSAQEIFILGVGTIQFSYPDVGHIMAGERIYAKFKNRELKKGELLTVRQLKAIHGQPVTIEVEGKNVVIGDAAWTEENEREMDDLPNEIAAQDALFNAYRLDYQEVETQLLEETDEVAKESLVYKRSQLFDQCEDLWAAILKKRMRLTELQTTHLELFATSLEEQARFEQIRYYAPHCVKVLRNKKFVPLWKSDDELIKSQMDSTRVLSLFSLFIRGVDVSFFADAPGEQTSS